MTATTPTPTFDFTPDFESKVAALALRDDRFAREAATFLKPEYFVNAVERNLVAFSQGFVQRYNAAPEAVTLFDLVRADKRVTPAEHPLYVDAISRLWGVDLKEREFIRERVVEFCRRQALLLAAVRMPDLLNKGKLDDIRDAFGKAFQIGEANQTQFYELFAEADKRRERRAEIASGSVITGVSTGFPEIDKLMYRRGWGRGELNIIMAPSKRGKTAFMMQTAVHSAVLSGTRALYITLEVDTEILSDRADACLTGTTLDQLVDQRDHVSRSVTGMGIAPATGKLYVERRPANTLTTNGVEAIIESYVNSGRPLDMVVVDYIGIMRLTPSDDRFIGLGNASKELRRIAAVHNVAMITGAQTNRDAVGKQLAAMDSIGESFAIVQDCDLLISLNANEAEMTKGVRRIFFAASRNQAEVTIKVQGDLAKMRMIESILEVTL